MSNNNIKLFKKRKILSASVLLSALAFIIYANAINGGFVWDDEILVQDNPAIRDWSKISDIFTQDMGGKEDASPYGFYRPFTIMTYAINWAFAGPGVQIYHLTNIILHILVALSIYFLVRLLFKDVSISLLTAILFLVHPIHTEAVAYISGRADSLAALFTILSFIFYIKYQSSQDKRLYWLILVGYVLALLSKENSLIFPAILLLYHYAFKKYFKLKDFLPILGLWVIYLFLRAVFLGYSLFNPGIIDSKILLARLPGFFVAIGSYIRLLFLPFDLHMEYGNYFFHFYDYRFIIGIIITLLLFSYAFLKKNKEVLFFFAILWFFITLLPNSSIYPMNAFYMAEHWLYLPSIGFFIIISKWLTGLYKLKRLKILALLFMLGILLFYSYLTIEQNNYWKDPITFYKRTLKYAPGNDRAYYNLGCVYGRLGNYPQAIVMFKKAIAINPKDYKFYNNLGTTYGRLGDVSGAIAVYKKAIEINPGYGRGYFNLAQIYYDTRQYELAVQYCDKASGLGYKIPPYFLELLKPYRDRTN
jgi:tetratricopeptide (TPR) repeat protein